MKRLCTACLIGAAALGVAAFAPSMASALSVHRMTLALPGGGTETIRYFGDVAPQVRFDVSPFDAAWAPFPEPSAFDRIAAGMTENIDALWQDAEAMMGGAGADLTSASLNRIPPGSSSYSIMSESMGGNRLCSRMTEITRPANGGKAKVVTRSSGNCGALANGGGSTDQSPRVGHGKLTPVDVILPAVY